MNNRYMIQWKSKVNGRIGRGSKCFTREQGEELVAELNRDYPEIEHELLTAPPEPPTAESLGSFRPKAVYPEEPATETQTTLAGTENQSQNEKHEPSLDENTRALSA